MVTKYSCYLLSTYYVPGTFHSHIQSFPMRQDSYFLKLKEVKGLAQGHTTKKRQICLTLKSLLIPLDPLAQWCGPSSVT